MTRFSLGKGIIKEIENDNVLIYLRDELKIPPEEIKDIEDLGKQFLPQERVFRGSEKEYGTWVNPFSGIERYKFVLNEYGKI